MLLMIRLLEVDTRNLELCGIFQGPEEDVELNKGFLAMLPKSSLISISG